MPTLGARKTTGRSRQLSLGIYYRVVLLNWAFPEIAGTFLNAKSVRRVRDGKPPKKAWGRSAKRSGKRCTFGNAVATTAQDLGIHESALRRWKQVCSAQSFFRFAVIDFSRVTSFESNDFTFAWGSKKSVS